MLLWLKSYWSEDRGLSLLLLFLCLALFVVMPLQQAQVVGGMTIALFFSLILISGVATISHWPAAIPLVSILVAVSLVVRWTKLSFGLPALDVWDAILSMLSCSVLAALITHQVFRDGPITGARIQGAIAVYLLLGLIWAFAYDLVARLDEQAFSYANEGGRGHGAGHFTYFSFVVLTTMGFGDITPVHQVARTLAIIEALVGQLFPAITLARLVSMQMLPGNQPPAAGSPPAPAVPDEERRP